MHWYDREPLTVWLPLSALLAGLVQTIAYTGYKFFYDSLSLMLGLYAGFLKPMLKELWPRSKQDEIEEMYDGLVILLLPLVACFIVILAGAPQLGGWTFLTVGLAAVVAEHIRARSRGEAHGSILMRFLAPRTYRGARRILLIVAATTLPASLTLAGSADVATLVFACALI